MATFQGNKYKAILRQDFLDYINRTFWITGNPRYPRVDWIIFPTNWNLYCKIVLIIRLVKVYNDSIKLTLK